VVAVTPAEAVISRLQAAGCSVAVVDGRLRVRAPRGALTDDLKAAARAFEPRIVAELTWDEAERALDACLDRIGRLCTALPDDATFRSNQGRVDREEAVNVAFARRDRQVFDAAIAELERYCVTAYAPRP